MREYLFRGKRMDTGEWVYGDLWTNKTNADKPIIHISTWELEEGVNANYEYSVIPGTVSLYTGLKDKHGNRIFEGDILEISGRYLQVVYDKGGFYTPSKISNYRLGGWKIDAICIAGNSVDNSELLNPPAESPALHTMIDPGPKQEEATQEASAAESAGQATEQESAGEGTTEG